MSCATKIPVDATLQAHFRAGVSSTRYFVVRVENEVCIEVKSYAATASLQNDWNTIAAAVGDVAAYILIRTGDEKSWVTITYVPSGTKIKDKMVYAATKSTLLEALGFQYFSGELHANDKDELSWAFYQGTLRPVDAYSSVEKARMELDDQEEEERRWRIEQHQQRQSALPAATAAAAARGGRGAPRGAARGGRGGASATPSPTAGASSSPSAGAGTGAPRGGARGGARGGGAASASLTPPAGSSTPPAARPVSGIGGFHAVDVPFDDSARSVLAQYESGSANFVEFKINDAKDQVLGVKASTATGATLSSLISTTEPRFYLYKHQGRNMLVYCCPPASARPLRMVYSTAKGSVADQCTASGVEIHKSVEVTEASEVNDSLFREVPTASTGYGSSTPSSEPPWASQRGRGRGRGAADENATRSRPLSIVSAENPHPIYSMMGANPTRATKKIVIPPKEAW